MHYIVDEHTIKKYRARAFCFNMSDLQIAKHLINIAKYGRKQGKRKGAIQLTFNSEYILIIKKAGNTIIKTYLGDTAYKKWCRKHDQKGRTYALH